MADQNINSDKEALRKEKLISDEVITQAKDQARTKAYAAKEQEIEKAQKIKETQRNEKRASEEVKDLAKEKARKETYLAREKIIADEQEARRSKNK